MLFDLCSPTQTSSSIEIRVRSDTGGAVAIALDGIEEQHYCEIARSAYEPTWKERFGRPTDRCFMHLYERQDQHRQTKR